MRFVGTLLGMLLVAGPVRAGLLDSPPPDFQGGSGRVVYRMGPVYFEPGHVDTLVTCTNLSDVPVNLALEIFDEEDARVRLARASAAGGADVTFATSADTGASQAVVVSELPRIDHGKARISATSSSLSCSAKHRTVAADGGVSEGPLELIKKVAF